MNFIGIGGKQKITTKGWSNKSPNTRERKNMLKHCGKKCFLGKNRSFPICSKHTCKINKKGVLSAYIRAKQYNNKTIIKIAKKTLKKISSHSFKG
jgi:hypothetical protein